MELGAPPKPDISETLPSNIAATPTLLPHKLRATSIVLFLILVLVTLAGGFYFYKNYFSDQNVPGENQSCTAEAKICPDGSSVGRSGPNCEFSPCPIVEAVAATSSFQVPSDWKTYRNEKYGFQLSIPADWKDYKVLELTAGSYEFLLKTTDKNYPTSDFPGYASMFYLVVFSKQEWEDIQGRDGLPRPIYIDKKNDTIFGYDQAQDRPEDILKQFDEIKLIISTFKFIK